MTNYLVVQAINGAILIGFGLLLVARTRAKFRRQIRASELTPTTDLSAAERRKLELRSQIDSLQRELYALDAAAGTAALNTAAPGTGR